MYKKPTLIDTKKYALQRILHFKSKQTNEKMMGFVKL